MLTKKPKERFQDPEDLIADLILVAEQYGWPVAARPIFIARTRSRWAEVHLPWVVPVAVFFFFMVFLDPLWLSNQKGPVSHPNYVLPELSAVTGSVTDEEANESVVPETANGISDNESDAIPPTGKLHDMDSPDLPEEARPAPLTKIIVSSDPRVGPSQPTLEQAIQLAAKNGVNRVEIWKDGFIDTEHQFDFHNRLTIAAGADFSPVLRLRSSSENRSMFNLTRGHLTLERLHLVVQTGGIDDRWSVIDLTANSQIELKDCSITFENSTGDRRALIEDVAIFRISEDFNLAENLYSKDKPKPTKISLENCVVRGEAALIRSFEAVPMDFVWNNGLLVTTERLLDFPCAASSFQREDSVRLTLNHLTAIIDQGLLQFTKEPLRQYFPNTTINATHCVFSQLSGSFTTWTGIDTVREAATLNYGGAGNLYHGMISFKLLRDQQGMPIRSLTFEEWSEFEGDATYGRRPIFDSIPDLPVSQHGVSTYVLAPDNPELSANHPSIGFTPDTAPSFKAAAPAQTMPPIFF